MVLSLTLPVFSPQGWKRNFTSCIKHYISTSSVHFFPNTRAQRAGTPITLSCSAIRTSTLAIAQLIHATLTWLWACLIMQPSSPFSHTFPLLGTRISERLSQRHSWVFSGRRSGRSSCYLLIFKNQTTLGGKCFKK
jgi:hypothetical protein